MSVSLTANTPTDEAPYVLVEVNSLPDGVDTLTVWRTVASREMKVRGMVGIPADGASGLDYEVPLGWETSYRAQYFDEAGEFVGWSEPSAVTLPSPDETYQAWMHNPLDPTTSVRVELFGQGTRVLARPVPVEIMQPAGRSVGVAIFRGPRRGYQGLVLDCVTTTEADTEKFDALFGGYDDSTIPIICVRTGPDSKLPPSLFVAVANPAMAFPDGVDLGGSMRWAIQGDEVSPPASALVTALLSYEDFTTFYSNFGTDDYAQFTSSYADYTEAQRDYSIAGSA